MDANEYRKQLFESLQANPRQINLMQPEDLMMVLNTFYVIDEELIWRMNDIQNSLYQSLENSSNVTRRKINSIVLFLVFLIYAGIVIFSSYCLANLEMSFLEKVFAHIFTSSISSTILVGYGIVVIIYIFLSLILYVINIKTDRKLLAESKTLTNQAEEVIRVSSSFLSVGQLVLPSYYLNNIALCAMLGYLENNRVASLADAINLYEQEAWQRKISSEASDEANRLASFISDFG